MKHICLQENNYDCGLACIKMMLAHYHKNKEFIKLNKEKVNARYSLLELKRYAEKYNLFLEGGKFDNKEELFNYPNSMIQIEYLNLSHFVIFLKKTKRYVYLIDPTIGKIRLDVSYFLSIFTGIIMYVKEVKPYHLKKEKNNIAYLKYLIVYTTYLILDFGLLCLISVLGDDSKYLFHNFLVILCLIILIICKINLINKHNKAIDGNICRFFESDRKLNVSTKQGLLKYKLYTIKYQYGFINTIFVIIFISFILLINGWYNLFIEILIGIIIFFLSKIGMIKNNSQINKINILENQFYKDGDVESYKMLIKESSNYSKNQSFLVVSSQFIIISIGIILNNVLEVNSFQFILFNSFYFLVLISKFNYLFKDHIKTKLEYQKYASTYNFLLKENIMLNKNE